LIEYTCQNDHIFGAAPKSFPANFPLIISRTRQLDLNSNQIRSVFAVTLILLLALRFIVLKTKIGTAMRACRSIPKPPRSWASTPTSVISFTFGLGSALAAAAEFCSLSIIRPLIHSWNFAGLKAFVAAVLGGIGNLPGAAAGASFHRRHRKRSSPATSPRPTATPNRVGHFDFVSAHQTVRLAGKKELKKG